MKHHAPAPTTTSGELAARASSAFAALRRHRRRLGQAASPRSSTRGGRLLAAGNGGSAAQAQHLTAELVGRYRDDRPPFSAICLSAETSSLTAIANDYPPEELFARQVAGARPARRRPRADVDERHQPQHRGGRRARPGRRAAGAGR